MSCDESPDLEASHNWLHRTAADMLPGGYYDPDLDDLVQEGRVAMWKAFEAYDDCKGTLAPWLTNAARMRMKDLAHGHGRWTGHTGRRGYTDATAGNVPRPLSVHTLLESPDFNE